MRITKFIKNKSGATAIEYGLIAALIAVGIILAASFLGQENSKLHEDVADKVEDVIDGTSGALN